MESLARGAAEQVAIHRLGRWGLQAPADGLAEVEGGRVRLANKHFLALARAGGWVRTVNGWPEKAVSLRGAVQAAAVSLEKSGAAWSKFRLRSPRRKTFLSVRLSAPRTAMAPSWWWSRT